MLGAQAHFHVFSYSELVHAIKIRTDIEWPANMQQIKQAYYDQGDVTCTSELHKHHGQVPRLLYLIKTCNIPFRLADDIQTFAYSH